MNLAYHNLKNGIRFVHCRTDGMVAHCGLIIKTGSRNEEDHEHGMAHFIEHMLFKGTKKRKPYHILSRLDDVGGELNAYTTKEETAIHASVLKENYERAVDLICDIAFNSVLPEKEIKKEKEVITEEINSYLDNPAELIFDEFEEMVFPNQPLGHNILGTTDNIKRFSRDDLQYFISGNYNTDEMVFCSVGNISDKKAIYIFEKYFSSIGSKPVVRNNIKNTIYRQTIVTKQKNTHQNHCIIGNVAYNIKHKKRTGMFLLNNILGGPGLNSRLNLSLREKNGLAYNVESGYSAYSDTGLFLIYFGTENNNFQKSTDIIMEELKKMRNKSLGIIQLSKAKSQIKGAIARAYENHENLMLSIGKSLLVLNRIDTLGESCRKIDNLNSSDLLEIANEIFSLPELSFLTYK